MYENCVKRRRLCFDCGFRFSTIEISVNEYETLQEKANIYQIMKKYKINNVGCDDETEGVFEFTEDQAAFLDKVFTELNEHSEYQCMPTIYIKCLEPEVDNG
jgi:transcriptional regulator NrdR family protein